MPRFYLPPSAIRGTSFTLSGTEAHHALNVLRKKPGDEIDLFDGKDAAFTGRIDRVEEGEIHGTVLKDSPGRSIPFKVTLYQALTRGSKWEWLLEKACEIGVSEVVPVFTRRTLIKLSAAEGQEKAKRWNRIALAASKQSGRTDLMNVRVPCDLSAGLAALSKSDLSLIPWEKESSRSVATACSSYKGKSIGIFIGPEGGWEASEIEQAERAGVQPVRLGPTLLRTETAGLVAVTLCLREFGVY